MLVQEVQVSFEHLLNLSLGGSEAGAVNFSFLSELLAGIIDQLGLAGKIRTIQTDADYREVDPSPFNIIKSKSKTKTSSGSKLDIASESRGQLFSTTPSFDALSSTANEKSGSEDSSQDKEALPTTPEEGEANTENARKPSIVAPDGDGGVQGRRRSSVKRHSIGMVATGITPHGQRGSLSGEAANQFGNASEMWHVMNVNRRVETAEAAIEGLTSLFDRMQRELEEVKNASDSDTGSKGSKADINKSEINAGINNDDKFIDINEKLKNMALKSDLQPFLNGNQINDLINKNFLQLNMESIHSGKPTPTQVATGTTNNDTSKTSEESTAGVEKVSASLTNSAVKIPLESIDQMQAELKKLQIEIEANNEATKSHGEKLEELLNSIHSGFGSDVTDATDKKRSSLEDQFKRMMDRIKAAERSIQRIANDSKNQGSEGSVGGPPPSDYRREEAPDIDHLIDPIKDTIASLTNNLEVLKGNHNSLSGALTGIEETMQSVQKNSTELNEKNETFMNAQRNMSSSISKLERDLEDTMDNIQRLKEGGSIGKSAADNETEVEMTKIRGIIFDLEEKQSIFQNQLDELSKDGRKKSREMSEMNEEIGKLDQIKVDKEFVALQMDSKADKKDLKELLVRDQFDETMNNIDRGIQNIMQEIQSVEAKNAKALNNISTVVEDKLDREEANQIRGYIDSRFKSFKPKMPPVKPAEDIAAGSRKRMVPDCNCISCNRPVDVPADAPCPTMPYFHALPGMKSIRPVTTFELQQIRQHMHHNWSPGLVKDRFSVAEDREKLQKELLQLCGVSELEELTMAAASYPQRPCGGAHTLANPRKNPNKPPIFYREDPPQFQPTERHREETNVVGKDGHVYKGRFQQGGEENGLPEIVGSLSRSGSKSLVSVQTHKSEIVTVLPSIE